jgi:alcohol dehydrogenase (cytochrome c)
MTGAPFVVKDQKSGKVLLVHGSSGDEFGVVGWLFARDPETGEEVWARPMVEGHMGRLNGKDSTTTGDASAPSWPRDKDGKLVEAWHQGGGAPWQTASYDVDRNMVVIGSGNPAPWNTWHRTQEGDDPRHWDSLFTSGQAYVDASTGELKGFFQHTPNDAWDFSGNNSVVLFEYKDPKTSKLVKASAHADRNGFFFVTDREKLTNGAGYPNKPTSLIGAWPFVEGITWASGFDLKTGKPIEKDNRPPKVKDGAEKGDSIFVSPPFLGGTNWMPMSYSPQTELFYIPANHWAMDYWTEKLTYKAGSAYLGQGFRIKRLFDDHVGILRAIDPKTGKIAWEHKEKFPLWAGTLTTAGGLLFTGTSDGYVKAFDKRNGKELWKFQTGSGVVSVPITWEMDGEQYLGIQSGYGGAVPLWGGDMADLTKQVTQGGSMWVFKLPNGEELRTVFSNRHGATFPARGVSPGRAGAAWTPARSPRVQSGTPRSADAQNNPRPRAGLPACPGPRRGIRRSAGHQRLRPLAACPVPRRRPAPRQPRRQESGRRRFLRGPPGPRQPDRRQPGRCQFRRRRPDRRPARQGRRTDRELSRRPAGRRRSRIRPAFPRRFQRRRPDRRQSGGGQGQFRMVCGARLTDANLQEAKLFTANLRGADLSGSYRRFAVFQGRRFCGLHRLPDRLVRSS